MNLKVLLVVSSLIVFLISASVFAQEKKPAAVQNAIEATTAKEGVKSTTLTPTTTTAKSLEKIVEKSSKLVCPGSDVARPFFALPCRNTKDCSYNRNLRCCSGRCLKGVPAPALEPVHSPTLFGLVDRVCPVERIPELLEIKRCVSDAECAPRICCPEKMTSGEVIGYCRTAEPRLDRLPGARRLFEPLKLLMSYMQCSTPPPPILDVFPKTCNSPLDCFPNLCCQERGRKICRPPKRSILTLVATIGQRLVPENAARDFISRLNK